MALQRVRTDGGKVIQDPPIAQFIFNDTRFAPVWLIVRLYIGWSWLQPGWGKLQNPAWMDTGEALKGYWTGAVDKTSFDWYSGFLQSMLDANAHTWFAKMIVIGEVAVGIALILGAFVGVAAFFGAFMNWNFIMAGSASSNALLGLGGVFLLLAWKTAGWYGLDRFLLPKLGTPWRPRENTRNVDGSLTPVSNAGD
jgi:thiosulfate dehydrogenase [quinone] large subunit